MPDFSLHYSTLERWFHLCKRGKWKTEVSPQKGKEGKEIVEFDLRWYFLKFDDKFVSDFVLKEFPYEKLFSWSNVSKN